MKKGKIMSTAATKFDDKISLWKEQMELPWAKLKYRLVQSNLAKHLSQASMYILDAGGGNGLDSVSFAKQGHFVDIVDYSQEMLSDIQPQERVATHLADVRNISSLFPDSHFDLIMCHNVLQYISDVPALIESFSKLLKPDGVISVVSVNRYSTPYHAAFLESRSSKAKIFNTDIISYSADEICKMMRNVGLVPEKDYGIRCITDYWGDNEKKSDPAIFEKIERFEFAATELHPYKLLARFFQVVARKAKSA
jgi:S-adenosylmethionine-dependent methyltransferase